MKRRLCTLLAISLALALALSCAVYAAAGESTVYVRKHVSILFDNSGSMREKLPGEPNLKWCYASYAAQVFTGLLNETDSLSLTFMDKEALENLDLAGPRQDAVTAVFDKTSSADADTPIASIGEALERLTREGLREGLGANAAGEQFWLVLTTDGVFREEGVNLSAERVCDELEAILERYPDLFVVYFGIGAQNDTSTSKAVDFREGSDVDRALLERLHSHPNFTAVYAETQEGIVATMQELSNRISGRYSVSNECEVEGERVEIYLSGEGSPIRNIAVMAQNTAARLVSAEAEGGKALSISREAQIKYPVNNNYDNVPSGTLGGYTALITGPSGEKLPSGNVILTFSEPVGEEDLLLMYEPAIHVRLVAERRNAGGEWETLPYSGTLVEGDEIRVSYAVCEDETDRELDVSRLFGKTEARILFNGQELGEGESVTVPEGDSVLQVQVSMMDGGYEISTSRTLHAGAPGAGDFTITSSGPIEMTRGEAAENTEKYVEFTVLYRGEPAEAEYLEGLTLTATGEQGPLKGETQRPEPHIFRFTPADGTCTAGTYKVALTLNGEEAASEEITILPNEVYYTAEAGPGISILSNALAENEDYVTFTVTAHRDEGDGPLTPEEAELFTIRAEDSDGRELKGERGMLADGSLTFTLRDASATPGEYTVTLLRGDEELASTRVTVIKHDAAYTVAVVVSDPDEVRRFALQKNTASVAFIVYEDGNICTADKLAAMLDQQIFVTSDLKSPFADIDVSIGKVDGKDAVICTPGSSTRSGFIRFFHYMIMSCGLGGLSRSSFDVSIKVDMVHGAEAAGTLRLVGYNIVYLIILIVTLVILTLVGMLIYSNMAAVRMKRGVLWYFEVEKRNIPGVPGYQISSLTEKRVGMGFKFMFLPINERHSFMGLKFTAVALTGQHKWPRYTNPQVTVSGPAEGVKKYFYLAPLPTRTELLNNINTGAIKSITSQNFTTLAQSGAALTPLGDKESAKATQTLMSGSLIYTARTGAGGRPRYQFWCFSAAGSSARRRSSPKRPRRKKR